MEIRQLEYFLMVTQTTSFTRAAERLFVSQPAVTNAVRGLEEELGILLFDRKQKQAVLTTEGKIFHAHVERLMHGISDTLEEIHAIKNLNGGVLHIGLTPLGGLASVAMLIGRFMDNYPDIRILSEEGDAKELRNLLMEDRLDMAILPNADEKPGFSYQYMERQELAVCCGRRHRFRRKNSISVDELSEEPFILLNDSDYINLLKKNRIVPGKKILSAAHVQTVKSLVAAGCGVAVLPECMTEQDDNLVTIHIEPSVELQTVIVVRHNRHLSHAAEAFMALARKEANTNEGT